METTNQNVKIYSAIASIQREIDAISKSNVNSQQGFKFRGIDDVYNAVHPLLSRHGVFSVPRVLESRYENYVNAKGTRATSVYLTVEYTFYADDGSSVVCAVASEGTDYADKASNKAMAFAHKYAILQVFSIPTEDAVDGDSDSVQRSGARVEPKAGPVPTAPTFTDVEKAIKEARTKDDLNKIFRTLILPFFGGPDYDDLIAKCHVRKGELQEVTA